MGGTVISEMRSTRSSPRLSMPPRGHQMSSGWTFVALAVCAVMCEPVSHPQFPANREKYREFFDLGASSADSIARSRCAAVTF